MWELQQHTDITVTDDGDDDDDDGSATFARSAHALFSLTFSTYSISPTSLLIATANICLTSTIYTSFSLFPFPHSISVCLWTLYHIIWIWYGFFLYLSISLLACDTRQNYRQNLWTHSHCLSPSLCPLSISLHHKLP